MADQKLSQLTAATTPLTGTETLYAVQSAASRKTTAQAVANLAPATDLSYTAATRTLASSTGADVVLPLATSTDAGLQSAADKTKLDSITVDTATVVRKYVRNTSGVPIPKGAAVYQTGSSGTTLTVALADASTEATAAQTLGLAQEAIAHNANGYVVAVGLLDGISTATLTEGQIVWLSETAGEGTTTRPTQPAHGVVLGYCVKQGSGTSGILYVKVDNGLEIEELHDVLISGATTGQVLRLASDGLWKNHTLSPADVGGHDAVTLAASVADVLDLSGQELRADDPGADRILFWDDSEGKLRHLSLAGGLSISGTTLTVPVEIGLACSDEDTALTFGTAKITFRLPYAMTLQAVRASVTTAPTGSTLVVDVNEGGTSVLSTKLSIDATEKTSTTAATAAVISDSALADDAEITIDIDQIGGTVAGAGLKVWLIGVRA